MATWSRTVEPGVTPYDRFGRASGRVAVAGSTPNVTWVGPVEPVVADAGPAASMTARQSSANPATTLSTLHGAREGVVTGFPGLVRVPGRRPGAG